MTAPLSAEKTRAVAVRPVASLDAALLDRRALPRRAPLSFAPPAAEPPAAQADDGLPDVVRLMARLARAIETQPLSPAQPRVAMTLRLDPARHARLRALAQDRQTSAQATLVAALDCYDPDASTPNSACRSKAPTGTQP